LLQTQKLKAFFFFADADFDSAQILNNAYCKHSEIICYHLAELKIKLIKEKGKDNV
jgi:hypothetical protein